jgi:putative phosphoesterase
VKVLVISDSHGAVFESHINEMKTHGDYDILIHCGDKYKDAQKFADKLNIDTVYQVPGNCDYDVVEKGILFKEIMGRNVLITHGHIHNVKYNLNALKNFAKENNADVVLFGHTHDQLTEYMDNILFFNPGSTIFPRRGNGSYGILEFTENDIKCSVMDLEN